MTADGKLRTVSATENEDLFWAIRGGGGNFGVITSLEYRLHPVGPIVAGGLLLYPMEQAPQVLRFFRDYAASVPDEMSVAALFLAAPPAPFVPSQLHGQRMVGIAFCYAGSIEDGMRVAAPLTAFGDPAVKMVGPMPFVVLQQFADGSAVSGSLGYNRGHYLKGLDNGCIDTLIEQMSTVPGDGNLAIVRQLGGAISRVSADATAYSERSAPFSLEILSEWPNPADTERQIGWTCGFSDAVEPHATGTIYVNFLGDEGDQWIKRAYSPANYARLAEIKQKYDPTNFFCQGQNIKPG